MRIEKSKFSFNCSVVKIQEECSIIASALWDHYSSEAPEPKNSLAPKKVVALVLFFSFCHSLRLVAEVLAFRYKSEYHTCQYIEAKTAEGFFNEVFIKFRNIFIVYYPYQWMSFQVLSMVSTCVCLLIIVYVVVNSTRSHLCLWCFSNQISQTIATIFQMKDHFIKRFPFHNSLF